MAFLSKLQKLFTKEKLNVIVIYISEAHAKDEWPISHANQTLQHKNMEERIKAAKKIFESKKSDFSTIKVLCDSFEHENFENEFSGWPERVYLIKNNKVKFISQHVVDGIDNWYDSIINRIN